MANTRSALVEQRLSSERLAPYRAECDGRLDRALALYEWNVDISTAFWRTLSQVEIVLRNALHSQLVAWSTVTYGEPRWFLDPAHVLSGPARKVIHKARQRLVREGRLESPGRVVAELSFGFWRYLLAARYERTLWVPALHAAFPHHQGGLRREVEEVLARLHHVRNRIAHHEPVHQLDLADLRLKAFTVVGWICPSTCSWVQDRCSIGTVLDSRPTLGAECSQDAIILPRKAVTPAAYPSMGRGDRGFR